MTYKKNKINKTKEYFRYCINGCAAKIYLSKFFYIFHDCATISVINGTHKRKMDN